jgi:hypothetical protein
MAYLTTLAPITALLLGAAIVFFMFPRKDEEQRLLARYQAADAAHVAGELSTKEERHVRQPAQ